MRFIKCNKHIVAELIELPTIEHRVSFAKIFRVIPVCATGIDDPYLVDCIIPKVLYFSGHKVYEYSSFGYYSENKTYLTVALQFSIRLTSGKIIADYVDIKVRCNDYNEHIFNLEEFSNHGKFTGIRISDILEIAVSMLINDDKNDDNYLIYFS